MQKVILSFNGTESREEIHEKLKETFGFPDYYGQNLDALYDCLTDLHEETAIGFVRTAPEAAEETGEYLCRVQNVFRDAEEENPHLAVFFPEDLQGCGDSEEEADGGVPAGGSKSQDLEDLQEIDGVYFTDMGAD